VSIGDVYYYKYTICSPLPDTEEGKLVDDMMSLIKSLEEKL
jgi:hypothetical protein